MSEAMKPEGVLTIEEIMAIIPHRHPFLLIDRVIHIDPAPPEEERWIGRKGTAIKNVTMNEPFFAGHFPHRPIMPGVIIVEAMAQTAAIVGHKPKAHGRDMGVLFVGIDRARFRKPVVPGDQLIIKVEVIKERSNLYVFSGEAFVDNVKVAEAEFSAQVFRRSPDNQP